MARTSTVPLALTGPFLAITIAMSACTRGGTGALVAPPTSAAASTVAVSTVAVSTVAVSTVAVSTVAVSTVAARTDGRCVTFEPTGHPVADQVLTSRALLLGATPTELDPAVRAQVDELADDLADLARQARAAPPADLCQ
jgi:hypothetical protein